MRVCGRGHDASLAIVSLLHLAGALHTSYVGEWLRCWRVCSGEELVRGRRGSGRDHPIPSGMHGMYVYMYMHSTHLISWTPPSIDAEFRVLFSDSHHTLAAVHGKLSFPTTGPDASKAPGQRKIMLQSEVPLLQARLPVGYVQRPVSCGALRVVPTKRARRLNGAIPPSPLATTASTPSAGTSPISLREALCGKLVAPRVLFLDIPGMKSGYFRPVSSFLLTTVFPPPFSLLLL